jgi:hypothetical protein
VRDGGWDFWRDKEIGIRGAECCCGDFWRCGQRVQDEGRSAVSLKLDRGVTNAAKTFG